MADPLDDLLNAIQADAEAADDAARLSARAAFDKARTAWIEGTRKGVAALVAEHAPALG